MNYEPNRNSFVIFALAMIAVAGLIGYMVRGGNNPQIQPPSSQATTQEQETQSPEPASSANQTGAREPPQEERVAQPIRREVVIDETLREENGQLREALEAARERIKELEGELKELNTKTTIKQLAADMEVEAEELEKYACGSELFGNNAHDLAEAVKQGVPTHTLKRAMELEREFQAWMAQGRKLAEQSASHLQDSRKRGNAIREHFATTWEPYIPTKIQLLSDELFRLLGPNSPRVQRFITAHQGT